MILEIMTTAMLALSPVETTAEVQSAPAIEQVGKHRGAIRIGKHRGAIRIGKHRGKIRIGKSRGKIRI